MQRMLRQILALVSFIATYIQTNITRKEGAQEIRKIIKFEDMGQSLLKLTPGNEVTKFKLDEIAGKCYEDFSNKLNNKDLTEPELFCEFYRAVCEAVEEINSSVGNTQFRLPKEEVLRKAFDTHHKGKDNLSEQEFQKILQDAIMETGFTGIGAKDVILYIFGIPATTFLIKKGVFPRAIPDGFFIPAVTSATVFALSKFNKI